MTIHSNLLIITPYIYIYITRPKDKRISQKLLSQKMPLAALHPAQPNREPWIFFEASQSITLRHQLWEEHARAVGSHWFLWRDQTKTNGRGGVQKRQTWYYFSRQIWCNQVVVLHISWQQISRFVSFKCGLNTKDWWTHIWIHLNIWWQPLVMSWWYTTSVDLLLPFFAQCVYSHEGCIAACHINLWNKALQKKADDNSKKISKKKNQSNEFCFSISPLFVYISSTCSTGKGRPVCCFHRSNRCPRNLETFPRESTSGIGPWGVSRRQRRKMAKRAEEAVECRTSKARGMVWKQQFSLQGFLFGGTQRVFWMRLQVLIDHFF